MDMSKWTVMGKLNLIQKITSIFKGEKENVSEYDAGEMVCNVKGGINNWNWPFRVQRCPVLGCTVRDFGNVTEKSCSCPLWLHLFDPLLKRQSAHCVFSEWAKAAMKILSAQFNEFGPDSSLYHSALSQRLTTVPVQCSRTFHHWHDKINSSVGAWALRLFSKSCQMDHSLRGWSALHIKSG